MNLYRLRITALSPLHIGTGEDFAPTNFIVDEGYLYEFDEMEFYRALPETLRQSFANVSSQGLQALRRFYINEKELAKEFAFAKIKASKSIEEKFHALADKNGKANTNQLEIAKTAKNANIHQAILPGSSLKGVIETALGNYVPKGSNDVRQNLAVSDFILIDGATQIGFARRKHKLQERDGKGVPMMNETVIPASQFVGTISSTKKGESDKLFTLEQIQAAVTTFAQTADEQLYKRYHAKAPKNAFVFRIGKNAGKAFMVPDISLRDRPKTHSLFTMDEEHFEPFGWIMCELIDEAAYQHAMTDYSDRLEQARNESVAKFVQKETARQAIAGEKAQLERQKAEEARKASEDIAAKEAALAAMSPVDQLISEHDDIAVLINKMRAGEIEEYDTIKIELAQKIKAILQKDLDKWDKAKKKALDRKAFIEGLLGK